MTRLFALCRVAFVVVALLVPAAASLAALHDVPLAAPDIPACGPEMRSAILVREAESLLGYALPEARREALLVVLGSAAGRLVTACTERTRSQLPGGQATASVEATVNMVQLHARLLGLGVLHSRTSPFAYSLETPLLDEGSAAATLTRLETAGGLSQRAGAAVRLAIRRDKGRWVAELTGPAGTFHAVSPAIEHLWSAVWGPYFSKQLELAPATTMTLHTTGWRDAAAARQLEQHLKLWSTAVRGVRLGEVNLTPRGATAQWSLDVINAAELANRLAGYASTHELRYELR